NVRYFNWRLCAEEVKQDFVNDVIKYGSKVALVHVSTRKYLTTNGIKYPDHDQDMVVCKGWEIDLKNDVFTIIEAYGTSVCTGSPVPLNSIIGFKHQATEATIWKGRDDNDDFVIKRSKNVSCYLLNGDIISITHVNTGYSALYSHPVLLDDGTQEVSCHGNGNDVNNKWRIELIDGPNL
ncbi:16024_t:CDS:2, partial [Funneliformis geosporum]